MPKAKLVVAEDDAVLRDLYVKKFTTSDFEIHTAANGEEAVALVDSLKPDLLIADIHMPKMDGFEILKHYPKQARTFPIILLTNFEQGDFKLRAMELGADDYFVKKDMTIKSLVEMVEKLLAAGKSS